MNINKIKQFFEDLIWKIKQLLMILIWNIQYEYRELKYKVMNIITKIFRGYSNESLWNLDGHLMKELARILPQFIKENPGGLHKRVYDNSGIFIKRIEHNEKETQEILETILYMAQHYNNDFDIETKYVCNDDPEFEPYKRDNEKYLKGLKYYSEYWDQLWW